VFQLLKLQAERHPARAGAVAGLFQQGSSMLVAILLVPISIHYLGPDRAGVWFAFQGLIAMLALLDMGFGFAISRQAAFTLGVDDDTGPSSGFLSLPAGLGGVSCLFHIMMRMYRVTALAVLVIGSLSFEFIQNFGRLLPPQDWEARLCWYALVVSATLQILSLGHAALVNGLGLTFKTKALAGALILLSGSLAVAAASMGLGLIGMGCAFLATAFVQWIAVRYLVPNSLRSLDSVNANWIRRNGGCWKQVQLLSKSAIPIGGVLVFASLIYTIQPTISGMIIGPESVTPYYVAQKIAGALNLVIMQICLPQLPFLTRLVGARDFKSAFLKISHVMSLGSLAFIVSGLLFYFLSPTAAKVLLHKQSYLQDPALAFLTVDFVVLGISSFAAQIILATGHNPFLFSTLLTGLLALCLSLVLTPHLGLLGLTLAPLLAGICFNYRVSFYEFNFIHKRLKTSIKY
jgi:O-antigen/teichoic acid export membrane protein